MSNQNEKQFLTDRELDAVSGGVGSAAMDAKPKPKPRPNGSSWTL